MSDVAAARKTTADSGRRERPRQATVDTRSARSPVALLQTRAGNRAVAQLFGHGAPLSDDVRSEMETRFGSNFGGVRVHDHPVAHAVAEALNAKALTFGSDVVFGEGHLAPASVEGRRLLAHELAHVIQQRRGGPTPSLQRDSFNEGAADRAASEVIGGAGPVAVQGASGIGVARAEKEGPTPASDDAIGMMLNGFRRSIVDGIVAGAGYGRAGDMLVARAIEGISDQFFQELWIEDRGKELLLNILRLGPGGVAKAFAGYQIGLVEGMASPLTDVFGMAVFAENARNLCWTLLKSAYNHADEIGPEVRQLIADSEGLAREASAALEAFVKDPNALRTLLSMEAAFNEMAQQKAYELGKAGASKVVATLESPWSEAEESQPAPELGFSTALSWAQSKAGAFNDWLVQSPGTKIGEGAGYAVGWVAIQVILLACTGGISGALKTAGTGLAKLGTAVSRVSPAVGGATARLGELVVVLGKAAHAVEQALNVLQDAALQPLRAFFARFTEPLKKFLGSLSGLLNKLRGVSEQRKLIEATTEATSEAIARRIQGGPKPEAKPRFVPEENPEPQEWIESETPRGEWSDVDPEDVPTQEFTPEERDRLVAEARERAAASAEPAAATPSAGPTLVPAETEAELKGLKVFSDVDEPGAESFVKSPDEIDVPEPAEAPGSTLVPAQEEAPRLASPRQEKKLIEAPTPDTSEVPVLDPKKKLQPAYVLDDPARPRITGEIGPGGFKPDPVPGDVAPVAELAKPTPVPEPTAPTLVPDTGPTIVPMEETGKVFVDVPEEPRAEGFVKWAEKGPEVRTKEIIEPTDEPTVKMTRKEMARIRAEAQMRAAEDAAKTGADWPEVVSRQELAPPPKIRKKKRRS